MNFISVSNWIQLAFALWTVIRVKPFLRIPWSALSMLWGKTPTQYKVFFNSHVEGNINLTDYLNRLERCEEHLENGFIKITVPGVKPVYCCEENRISFLVLLTAIVKGDNVISEELDVSAFIKVQRVENPEKMFSKAPFLKISIRCDPEAIEFIENWPLRTTVINNSLPLIPLVFQARNLQLISACTFYPILLGDFFSEQIQAVIEAITDKLCVLVQLFVGIFPASIRVYLYFILYAINRSLVSCNFITNKRQKIKTDKIIINDSSYFFCEVKREKVETPVVEVIEGQVFNFKGDGFQIDISVEKIEGLEVDFHIELFAKSVLFRSRYSVKKGRNSVSAERFQMVLMCLSFMESNRIPPVKCNSSKNKFRMHCYNIEEVFDKVLNSQSFFRLISIEENEYEFFDNSLEKESFEAFGVVSVEIDSINSAIVDSLALKNKKIFKELLKHNMIFFRGEVKLQLLLLILKFNKSVYKFQKIKSSELKIYVSDVNRILLSHGEKKLKAITNHNESGSYKKYMRSKSFEVKILLDNISKNNKAGKGFKGSQISVPYIEPPTNANLEKSLICLEAAFKPITVDIFAEYREKITSIAESNLSQLDRRMFESGERACSSIINEISKRKEESKLNHEAEVRALEGIKCDLNSIINEFERQKENAFRFNLMKEFSNYVLGKEGDISNLNEKTAQLKAGDEVKKIIETFCGQNKKEIRKIMIFREIEGRLLSKKHSYKGCFTKKEIKFRGYNRNDLVDYMEGKYPARPCHRRIMRSNREYRVLRSYCKQGNAEFDEKKYWGKISSFFSKISEREKAIESSKSEYKKSSTNFIKEIREMVLRKKKEHSEKIDRLIEERNLDYPEEDWMLNSEVKIKERIYKERYKKQQQDQGKLG